MAISSAVGQERISRIVGYKLTKGFFQESSPNLPQRIAVFGEANVANQASIDDTPREITSAAEAGDLYGYGSPIHSQMRILRPPSGGGIGGIPTIVYPQLDTGGEIAAVLQVTSTGTATKTVTHTVVINGRRGIDSALYDFVVPEGSTDSAALSLAIDAVNNALSTPVIAVSSGPTTTDFTAKWVGVTSNEVTVEIDTNGEPSGMTYVSAVLTAGAGDKDIQNSLDQFGSDWNTIVLNPYGEAKHAVLNTFNGIPDPDLPTGRYTGIVFKPFIALWGSIEQDKDTLAAITDAQKTEVTNVLCPAPNSAGFTWEAAANGGLLFARIMQDTPHLDINGKAYPDMPVPVDGLIGDMADYENRDFLVKKGSSTVDFIAGKYVVQDFVTTYHPDGETPPQFRYARNLIGIDFNVRYGYLLLEAINVVDHAIVEDLQPVSVGNTIKPKQWIQILNNYSDDLASRGLIVDSDFMKDSLDVGTSETNPDRFESFFSYKRSPYARVISTTAQAGFAFGL